MTISIAQVLSQEAQGPCPPLAETLEDIRKFFARYVTFPKKEHNIVIALWAAHTWVVMQAFDYTPYLFINSPVKRCGKTRTLDCLNLLCRGSFPIISATEAVLFRKIEQDTPTLLIDEVDTIFRPNGPEEGKEGIRAVLNAGFERKAVVPRCVGPNFELKDFHVFCPKVMAGIDRCLPDTVADRSITIVMERQRPGQSERFRAREATQLAQPIAQALENWSSRLNIQTKLAEARPDIPPELGDRAADICEPLLAIADMAGGKWPDISRPALVTLFAESESGDDNVGTQILKAIREIFEKQGDDRVSTPYLLNELIERDNGEPWGGW